jgi:DNA-binding PucR family transcriptional regulator
VAKTDALLDFYKDTIGKLIDYDNEYGTDYHGFIKVYIENDGRQGDVSEKMFIHRNTANNYVKKAEEIMDLDLMSWEDKAKLYTAYCIENLL